MAGLRGLGDKLINPLGVVPSWLQFGRRFTSLAHAVLPPRPPPEGSPLDRAMAMITAAQGHELDAVVMRRDASGWLELRYRARDDESEAGLAREIWETLAPPGWLEDDTRQFADASGVRTTVPGTLIVALTMLADPQRLITAEAIAREAHTRLTTWGSEPLQRLVWRVCDERTLQTTSEDNVWRNDWDDHDHDVRRCARQAFRGPADDPQFASHVGTDLYALFVQQPGPRQGQPGQYERVRAASTVEGAWWWSKALEFDCEITHVNRNRPGWPLVLGRRFSEIPSPFEPLLALHEIGHPLIQARHGTLMLVAPQQTWMK